MSFKASPDGTFGEILVNGAVVAKLPVTGNAVIPGLVGTVSQSGGIPTGAVVESGSNANGEYVRFADGTQVCWKEGLTTTAWGANAATPVTPSAQFPASFVSPPSATAQLATLEPFKYQASVYATTNTAVTIYVGGTSASSSSSIRYFAIGRWF